MSRFAALAQTGTHWIGMGLDLLFPPHCVLCEVLLDGDDQFTSRFCVKCLQQLESRGATYCSACGAVNRKHVGNERLTEATSESCTTDAHDRESHRRCSECSTKKLLFAGVTPWGIYRGTLRDVIVRMKYPAGRDLAAAWGPLLAQRVRSAWRDETELAASPSLASVNHDPQVSSPAGHVSSSLGSTATDGASTIPDAMTCIPKAWLSRLQGTANSAETIMLSLAQQLRIPALPRLLRRVRRTRKQSMLGLADRWDNVRGSLAVNRHYGIEGTHILVVDDIMTTGATANEAARALRAAGAARVTVAVVGRAVSHR